MIDILKRKMRAVLRRDPHPSRTPGTARRAPVATPVDNPRASARIIDLLQSYRASESLNARYCGIWTEVSPNARMRGGLRIVQAREGTHARLMRERLKELGETQFDDVPQARQDRAIDFFASRGRSDVRKLRVLKPMMNASTRTSARWWTRSRPSTRTPARGNCCARSSTTSARRRSGSRACIGTSRPGRQKPESASNRVMYHAPDLPGCEPCFT